MLCLYETLHRPTLLITLCLAFLVTADAAAAPQVSDLNQRGLQIGGTSRIVLSGTQLNGDTLIVARFPIAKQEVIEVANGNQLTLDVTLADNVAPGMYAIRLVNSQGISSPVVVSLDRLPNVAFGPKIEQLPVALYGDLRGGQILKTEFQGKKGQPLVVEVEGQRLGSMIRPVLRIYDSRGTQLQWAQPFDQLAGDTRVHVILPEDGTYSAEMHDMLLRGPNPSYFRLKIGDLKFADGVYPVAATRNSPMQFSLLGSNLPDSFRIDFQPGADQLGWTPLPVQGESLFSGNLPAVRVTDVRQYAEPVQPAPQQNAGAPPLGINGRLLTSGEVDRFVLDVKPQQKLRFDMLARRIGSALDGNLVLKNASNGAQLAANDDRPNTTDPGFDYTVADGITQLLLEVSDITAKGGTDQFYLIEVADLDVPAFKLKVSTDALNIPTGGTGMVQVTAERNGYNGQIDLAVKGLPQTAQVAGNMIPAGMDKAILTISNAAEPINSHWFSITGKANQIESPEQTAVWPATAISSRMPWLSQEIGIAVSEKSLVEIAWDGAGPEQFLLGGRIQPKINLRREPNGKGVVRLRLETSQTIPTKTIKENNQDKVVDDVDRALRLTNPPMLDDSQSSAIVDISVPADLSEQPWAIVLVAELLSADQKQVLATSVLPTRFVPAKRGLTIKVAGEPKVDVELTSKKFGALTGEIQRLEGGNLPVTVSLAGLPAEIKAPAVVVPADQNMFALTVELPETVKPEQLNNVSLVATVMDQQDAAIVKATSNSIKVAVTLVPAAK